MAIRIALSLTMLLHLSFGFCPADEDVLPDPNLPGDEDLNQFHGVVGPEGFDAGEEPEFVEADGEDDFDGNEFLKEFSEAVTSAKMDKIYTLKKKQTSARLMLDFLIRETTMAPEYLTNLFIQKAAVDKEKDLEKMLFNEKKSLEFLTQILHHLQENPTEPVKRASLGEETSLNNDENEKGAKDEL